MELNEKILQIRGKATLLDDIERDQAYTLRCDGEIIDIREPSNDDGTFNRVYVFQVSRAEVIDNLGKTSKTKDTRSRSKQLRAVITREWREGEEGISAEEYYDREMKNIIVRRINKEI